MPTRPSVAAVACALLVVSAGCAGLVGSDGGTTTDATTTEPSPTTETTSEPTETSAERLAPGLTRDGVVDAAALADAHRDAVRNHSFTRQSRVERTNDSATVSRESTMVAASESHWRWRVTTDGTPLALGTSNGTFVQYADGEQVVWRLESPARENATYGVRSISVDGGSEPIPPAQVFPSALYERDLVYSLFGNADVTVERANESAIRVRGTVAEMAVDREQVTDVAFAATVTPEGLVESLEMTYEQDGATVERTVRFERTGGDPVERPGWYDTALNRTAATGAGE
ncbi:hypothetical protein [Halobacterium litoreum]|uniref:Outer membrane lipoprotein-sorting protein n=1 Tax=Halobacterium litoreum TaxID=2039234 RepID=A0ABD5NE56_9EURY|nr:hypothetical protein [Halobacterium litoreum]UHH13620.1 hypothetical protein LT972_01160 [Halobacterium litoreum]